MSGRQTRVFVVDDHPVVRAGLREIIGAADALALVGEAESGGPDTADAVCAAGTDVAVLDIRLKQGSGIDLCRALKSREPEVRVVLLSAFWDESLVRCALDANTDAYVLKDAEHFDLVKTISRVASGESYFDPLISSTIVRRLKTGEGSYSDRDRAILTLVAGGRTNREIGEELFLSAHTVRDRLSELMEQLGARNRTEAAQLASQRGLI